MFHVVSEGAPQTAKWRTDRSALGSSIKSHKWCEPAAGANDNRNNLPVGSRSLGGEDSAGAAVRLVEDFPSSAEKRVCGVSKYRLYNHYGNEAPQGMSSECEDGTLSARVVWPY